MTKPLILIFAALMSSGSGKAQPVSPEGARIYLSQGEWRGAVLTESGHQIVSDAAKASASAPSTVIDINGMADLGATSTSHRRLSDSRVAAVREELIRDGVVAGDIGVQTAERADGAAPLPKDGPGQRVTIVVHY